MIDQATIWKICKIRSFKDFEIDRIISISNGLYSGTALYKDTPYKSIRLFFKGIEDNDGCRKYGLYIPDYKSWHIIDECILESPNIGNINDKPFLIYIPIEIKQEWLIHTFYARIPETLEVVI